jgi:diguanylate cyclase (GGDEF)-like protein
LPPIASGMEKSRPLVLVADDDGVARAIVSSWLSSADYEVLAARDGTEALQLAAEHDPDLLLVDVTMPGPDGFEVCRAIQERGAVAPPVIFLTAHTQTTSRVAGLEAGAVDYIVKPFDQAELVARVRAALRTKATRDALAEQATHDPLTGLFNRRQLDVLAAEAISTARRYDRALSCLMLDLDHFKQINDRFGHLVGDEVLRGAATRLGTVIRAADIFGRYGGEEFVVILPETEPAAAVAVAAKLHAALSSTPFELDAITLPVTASIGVAGLTGTMAAPTTFYAAADAALYRAKELGRNRTELHEPSAA